MVSDSDIKYRITTLNSLLNSCPSYVHEINQILCILKGYTDLGSNGNGAVDRAIEKADKLIIKLGSVLHKSNSRAGRVLAQIESIEEGNVGLDAFLDMFVSSYPSDIFNPYQYFKDNYKEFQVKDGTPKMAKKQCFTNAALVAKTKQSARYVEGWMTIYGVPIQHAWNVEGNQAYDYTFVDPQKSSYFGIEIPEKLLEMTINHKGWTMSTGVLDAMRYFTSAELKKAKKLLGA